MIAEMIAMDGHWLSCFIVEKFYKKSGKGLLQSGGIVELQYMLDRRASKSK